MRKPLTPLQAFAEDARHAAERASDLGDALIPWLSVAQSADQLSASSGVRRTVALDAARALLVAFANERPTMRHDVQPAPSDQLERVAEQFRAAAEAMERAGCFELAYTTVSAICRLTARADYVSAALATVHLGRIARQMNDLSTAEDCYVTMLNTSMRERDGPLAARGHIGLALLHDTRGNMPAAEAEYLKALELAVPSGMAFASACQGLMTISLDGGRVADALIYGWQLYDATEHDLDARTAALADLSVVALRAGFFQAAMSGFEHALTLSQVARVHMVTLSGAVRAAARLGDLERVRQFDQELLRDIARANLPHVAAMVLLYSAESWAVVGQRGTANARLQESRGLANRFGFHEYEFKADTLAAGWARAEQHNAPVANVVLDPVLTFDRQDPHIGVGIHRLEALSV
ncbi:MAG: hypothetical protein IPP90_00655 [Gemmatimonadaceae bacterium]|nr:hypothetical protein [Gemmatimonadaceae bacterium]